MLLDSQDMAGNTCIMCSVFEGQLCDAQLRRFQSAVESALDLSYDNVLVYTFPPGAQPRRLEWGAVEPAPSDIL